MEGDIRGYISTHSLAELYSVLTRLPHQSRVSPSEIEILFSNLSNFEKVALDADDYVAVIRRLVKLNLTGGSIFDALIAQAALKAKVDFLLTANPKDFIRLGQDVTDIVRVPTAP